MLLELKNIVKFAEDRCLFKIDHLTLAAGEKIGVVGRNGIGKSTLLALIAGQAQPDQGSVKRWGNVSYITQLGSVVGPAQIPDRSLAQQFAVGRQYTDFLSGGEKSRYKIAVALSEVNGLLLADEPTANLDIDGRALLQAKLQAYQGALVIVSHDRQLLDAICHAIWDIDAGKVTVYRGNYTSYVAQKRQEKERQQHEYENYIHEKKQLEAAAKDRRGRSSSTRKTPKRMGNSEARLHKMGDQKAKANLDKAVKAIESRLAKLTVKTKPRDNPTVAFNFVNAGDLYSKVVVRGQGIDKCFGGRVLFRNAEFSLLNGQKVALVGPNGCGKTTLLNIIVRGEAQIAVASKARIGYYAQGMENLDLEKSVLANVLATSVQQEGVVRDLLAQLLFCRNEVFKPAGVLSGGERTRVSLAKLIASDANVLLLDEPANYLDLPSLEALEAVLTSYDGTILFVAHDRQFIDKVATDLMLIENGKLQMFQGNYSQYHTARQEKSRPKTTESKMVLEYRLAEVLSRLSVSKEKDEIARLDREYRSLSAMLKG